jgi:hypothetical protein
LLVQHFTSTRASCAELYLFVDRSRIIVYGFLYSAV